MSKTGKDTEKSAKAIRSAAELAKLAAEEKQNMGTRGEAGQKPGKERIVLVCVGGGCVASGSMELKQALEAEVKSLKLSASVRIVGTGCMGPCAAGPVMAVYPEGVFYEKVKPSDAREIAETHLKGGEIVERLLHMEKSESGEAVISRMRDIPFLGRQTKYVLRNCGRIDPLRIEEYIAEDGYKALAKVLGGIKPDDVIETIKRSGLRGRGGAGFPTWLKWSLTRKAKGDVKYVLCNGDEGDPGAFMDRSVLEGDPHSVIEAMAIAGYAVGSSQGFVYVRAEYPLAVERLEKAIKAARERGLLGKGILGSSFDFDLEIRMGSGAFVCGEETALMTSVEGNRGEPRPRPPFPANEGLWGRPSLLNNVETYAVIPAIITNGADWYAKYGTEKSKGTKVFALAGTVNNTGLVEIPIGTPLGEIVYDIGGGIPNGKSFKAAQIGGPSGGCIPKEHLNVPVDYESLTELGAIMGSGGLIIMDEDTCMVDMARYFLDFVQEESCGKCSPCRVGTKRMLETLERICRGEGVMEDIAFLEDIGAKIKDSALCGLGQTAPNPVLSTIRHFRDEYVAHIRDKRCPAGVCAELVRAPCQNACPAGVDVPGFVSLVSEKRYEEALRRHRERNPFVSVCSAVCFHPCEHKCRRASLDSPLSVLGVKKFLATQEKKPILPEIRKSDANAKRKIAIVGAGPSGLSCAYFLARLGYRPEVFEAAKEPGGMLVQTIPAYRLPRKELSREIEMIRSMGATIRTGKALGRDFTLKDLKEKGYEAVYLAVGAPQGSPMKIEGENAEGVIDAIRFLREYNLSGKTKVGREVAVIGGGNAAIDVARTALRLGAKTVRVIYRRTREEMPAWDEEIEAAVLEGVVFEFLTAPNKVEVEGGKTVGIVCQRMELAQFDKSGRKRPTPKEGSEFTIRADLIVSAIGQSLDAPAIMDGTAIKLSRQGYLEADPVSGQSSVPWIFAGGDAASGPASVVEAVAAGERAAVGIDRMLSGETHAFWRRQKDAGTSFDPDADPVSYERAKMPQLTAAQRKGNFDQVDRCWDEAVAVKEARRCLRCDYRETPSTEE